MQFFSVYIFWYRPPWDDKTFNEKFDKLGTAQNRGRLFVSFYERASLYCAVHFMHFTKPGIRTCSMSLHSISYFTEPMFQKKIVFWVVSCPNNRDSDSNKNWRKTLFSFLSECLLRHSMYLTLSSDNFWDKLNVLRVSNFSLKCKSNHFSWKFHFGCNENVKLLWLPAALEICLWLTFRRNLFLWIGVPPVLEGSRNERSNGFFQEDSIPRRHEKSW